MSSQGSSSDTSAEVRDRTRTNARDAAGMIRRMAIKLTSSTTWQLVGHVLLDGVKEAREIEFFGTHGVYARPANNADAEAIVAFVAGEAENPAVIASRDQGLRRRLAAFVQQAETVLHNAAAMVHILKNGQVHVRAIDTDATSFNVALNAQVRGLASQVEDLRVKFNAHFHGSNGAAPPIPSQQYQAEIVLPVGSDILYATSG